MQQVHFYKTTWQYIPEYDNYFKLVSFKQSASKFLPSATICVFKSTNYGVTI